MDRLAKPVTVGRRPRGAAHHRRGGRPRRHRREGLPGRPQHAQLSHLLRDEGTRRPTSARPESRTCSPTCASEYPDLRIHLAGHSFGARRRERRRPGRRRGAADRLGVAAPGRLLALQLRGQLGGQEGRHVPARSCSRSGSAARSIITHTRNDKAVGVAYAIASRVAGQVARRSATRTTSTAASAATVRRRHPRRRAATLLAVGAAAYDLQPGACTTCSPTSSSAATATSPAPRSPTPCCRRLPLDRT